ncbi:response regulator [Duganella sp. CY15W]|uniref:sensor histidine kinase n=1 Tax=Duganella sp. CY15W TaxID=2692172 RepID=UPI00136C1749|nr:response regulator [Duganella sp. CY15W]MYM30924.1 response regulator [Duganella sp. CY15W]
MPECFNILVVDDNVNNRITMRALLGRLPNIAMMEAGSGAECLMMTVEHIFHLILLDVQMPEMDGFETALHLQMTERTRNIPIVFVTATLKAEEFSRRGYGLGAVDYLAKPLDDNLLLNRVRLYQSLHEREATLESHARDLQDALDRLRVTQDKLVQSEKLAALSPIVAAVAHELNTPIGNCMTVSSTLDVDIGTLYAAVEKGETLKRSQLLDSLGRARTASQLILRGMFRTAELVSNFKQVAVDHASSQRRTFDLKDIVGGVVMLMNTSLHKTAYRIQVNIPGSLWLDSYPGPIDQIISNLINNSVLHGFEGRKEGLISIEAQEDGDYIRLLYHDDGCGMSDEVKQHVFDPFFTTRLGKGGSGLGMSICYNLVTGLLGGTIEVADGEPSGSLFTILLARKAPLAASP